MGKKVINHINYALVEGTRPAMYRAIKYWGKKPHNIWGSFIEAYTSENDVVLDPFAGSNVAAFEAVKLKRKSYSFDLNPLSAFIVEAMNSDFNKNEFIKAVNKVVEDVNRDETYKEHYIFTESDTDYVIYNYRWLGDRVEKVYYKSQDNKSVKSRLASETDIIRAKKLQEIIITSWFPSDDIGGNGFQYLWTRRNLYILSLIFDKIVNLMDENVKLQLLFGFVQCLHLTSKMVVPRTEKSNREFSGSWGRADYMIRKRQMEQNPLIVFTRSCLAKQGVLSALEDYQQTYLRKIRITDINSVRSIPKNSDIVYGVLDIVDLTKKIKPKTIDFIITDPPYAGLVQYLDLSMIWLIWLKRINPKYEPDFSAEITIKKGIKDRADYSRRLQKAFKEMYTVLKDEGYLVVTFHHKELVEWNEFINAVKLAGFKFDKVTHQYNKRSGEANVANPYGTSGADFYIRCTKHRNIDFSDNISSLDDFIFQKTLQIIALRNEPTKYEFILTGLLPEMIQAGFVKESDYKTQISRVLQIQGENKGIIKHWKNDDDKAGDYWWFVNPGDYIVNPDLPLSDRIEESIVSILRRQLSVKLDDILAELFRTYPNGLTPDPRNLVSKLSKYAYRAATYWKIKPDFQISLKAHTEKIFELYKLGAKLGFQSHIGFRERGEICNTGEKLDKYSLPRTYINSYSTDKEKNNRIQMIDIIWFDSNNSIGAMFEVENSTNFVAAIIRGSNLENNIRKFMVIPDQRSEEFSNLKDPLFLQTFKNHGWRYLLYSDISRLSGLGHITIDNFLSTSKTMVQE
jgi:16S rRNA G966 N2-methylase RsmD/SAM-dependent methyltransferase